MIVQLNMDLEKKAHEIKQLMEQAQSLYYKYAGQLELINQLMQENANDSIKKLDGRSRGKQVRRKRRNVRTK